MAAKRVLIAPLWNWNKIRTFYVAFLVGSNRTFMELKSRALKPFFGGADCSNRTFMELKCQDQERNLQLLVWF